MSATQTLAVSAFGTDPSSDDPRDFALTSSTLSVSITSSNPIATPFIVSDTDTDLFPFLKMVVTGTQGAATGGQSLYALLSADLLLREA
jgi:hypothetical protein